MPIENSWTQADTEATYLGTLRGQAADSLLSIAGRVAAAGVPPMSMEEINAEVKAARAERKQRAGGH